MNVTLRRFDAFTGHAMACRSALVWGSILLLGALSGCSTLSGTKPLSREKRLLREELHRFADFAQRTADQTVMKVQQKTMSEEHRESITSWRIRFIEECRTATSRGDPLRGLFDVWMLCRRALNYFETDDSAAVLRESQPIVLDATRRIHDRIETIAAFYLKEKKLQRMRKEVIERAKAHPTRGTFADERSFSDTEPGKDVLKFLLDLGTMPLRAVADLTKALGSLVYRLPGVDQSAGVQAILEHLDKSQPELQKTLGLVRDTAQSIENTVTGAPEAAKALQAAAEAIGQAKKETGTLWSTPGARGAPTSSENGEPFSWQGLTDSAEACTEMAAQVRGLVGDVRNLTGPSPLSAGKDAISAGSHGIAQEIRALVTHGGQWGDMLIGLLFVLMLLYRGITNRFLTVRSAP